MYKILFYSKLIYFLYKFRAQCAHHEKVKIVLNILWYHQTYRCYDINNTITTTTTSTTTTTTTTTNTITNEKFSTSINISI